ncbi:hypothetical protein BVX94_00300 [bacterium B17]|nr:hypothetical protein BVX94_00300 [bacterium B17]
MPERNDPSKTLRIDIHPDYRAITPEAAKSQTVLFTDAEGSSISRRKEGHDTGSPEYIKLLESIYDAVIITDFSGIIVDFNTRAVDMFRTTDENIAGANVLNCISGSDESLLSEIKLNLDEDRRTMIEAYCQRFDESLFPSEVAVNQIELDTIDHLCFFVRDVTTRKKVQAALEEAVARLEEHDRSKTQFVSNVSHELRTPLTSMMYAVTNMLKGVLGELPDKVKRYLHMMEGDCKRMLGTVNDILDLRKIDESTLTLTKSSVEFGGFARSCAESLRVLAEQKGLQFDVLESSSRWFVSCDVHKMERVIINLLDNAIKFTHSGGKVGLMVDQDPDDENYVLFSVRDSGIGIPPEALENVTARYFTVGDQPLGTGLGLALSREIVEHHDGSLTVISPPPGKDKGTLVNVKLPKTEAPLILLVDDEEYIRHIISGQLQDSGYRVETAENGSIALDLISSTTPDLVILDLILPDMHGTDVIVKMKSVAMSRRIPVIVITGGELSQEKAAVLNSFAIPVLVKPWEPDALLEKISEGFLGVAVLNRENS